MATTVRLDAAQTEARIINRTLRRPLDDEKLDKLARFIHRGGMGYVHFVHFHLTPQAEFCPCMKGECRAVRDMDKALRPKREFPEARKALVRIASRYA